jgi:DNA-binding response OmpR family regulator
MKPKILVVDDDMALAKTIGHILAQAYYQPVLAYTAEDGLVLAQRQLPDLALLDVMVPAMGGWELCRRMRRITAVPIIFLTALDGVDNVVQGLEVGADDYLVKPFEQAELLARVMAHLRRASAGVKPSRQRHELGGGALIVDVEARTVWLHGAPVDLTPREFDLIAVLAEQAGHVVRTTELVERAWHMQDEKAAENVKPYIHYLRKKLEADPAAPRWIQTVRGVGYRLAAE